MLTKCSSQRTKPTQRSPAPQPPAQRLCKRGGGGCGRKCHPWAPQAPTETPSLFRFQTGRNLRERLPPCVRPGAAAGPAPAGPAGGRLLRPPVTSHGGARRPQSSGSASHLRPDSKAGGTRATACASRGGRGSGLGGCPDPGGTAAQPVPRLVQSSRL